MGGQGSTVLSIDKCSFHFLKKYKNLLEVLTDRQLAQLGDAYVNFVYSLALSERKSRPEGKKVKGSLLAEALKKAGLRETLPSGMDRHALSDAAEAIVVYAWLKRLLTLNESAQTLIGCDSLQVGMEKLLREVNKRVMHSGLFEDPH